MPVEVCQDESRRVDFLVKMWMIRVSPISSGLLHHHTSFIV